MYNEGKVKELVVMAMGDRTINMFAQQASLSHTHLKRIVTGESKITVNIINKITSEEAAPQGNVTAEQLMVAAGYMDEPIRFVSEAVIKKEVQENLERAVESVLFKTASKRGTPFLVKDGKEADSRFYLPSFLINLNEGFEYWIDIKSYKASGGRDFVEKTYLSLSKLVFVKYNPYRVIVIIVDTEEAYKSFLGYKEEFSYKGNLEIALLDISKMVIIKETILTSVDDKGFELLFNK